jgi:hypothetical protein
LACSAVVACSSARRRVDLEAFWHGIMTPWTSPLRSAGVTRRSARCSLGLSCFFNDGNGDPAASVELLASLDFYRGGSSS